MTKTIIFKVNEGLLEQIDKLSKEDGYTTRTDFIKAALHEKIDRKKIEQAMIELSKFKGKATSKTSDEKIRQIRDELGKEILKKINK